LAKDNVIQEIRGRFPGDVIALAESHGDPVLVLKREALRPVFESLKKAPFEYSLLLDATCVDYLAAENRFELVYHLYSISRGERLRVKVSLPEGDFQVDSLAGLWHNANWLEREIYDMFGVEFRGHPDLRRILTYEEFEGHPLRKSYPWRKRQPRIPMEGQ
jgi:NADH-quinone oxidoreductase subunit C